MHTTSSATSRRWRLLTALLAGLALLWGFAFWATGATTCPRESAPAAWLPCLASEGDGDHG